MTNLQRKLIKETEDAVIPELSRQAEKIVVDEHTEMAIDWFNGRRTPDANQLLTGGLFGLDLGSDAPRLFSDDY